MFIFITFLEDFLNGFFWMIFLTIVLAIKFLGSFGLETFQSRFNSASFRIEVTLILIFYSNSTNWTEIMPRIDRVEGEDR